jgi:thymidylate synthase
MERKNKFKFMNHPEYQYLNLLKEIIENGSEKEVFLTPEVKEQYQKEGRNLPYIKSIFGSQIRFDLSQGFPLLTTKKVFFKGILHELLWFLKGDTNIKYLVDNNIHIWDDWAWKRYYKDCLEKNIDSAMNQEDFINHIKNLPDTDNFVKEWGNLIYSYGRMWRAWPASDGREIDQLGWVINGLKDKPFRKSYVVSAWNPDFIYAMASEKNKNEIPPFCHTMFQFAVTEKNKLNLGLYQRSADMFLGVPFNIASYSVLLLMVAQVTNLEAGEFVHTFGDAHIYSDHLDQVNEQISREPKKFPSLKINSEIKDIDGFEYSDFSLENYDPHPVIKAPITNVGGF